MLLSKSVAHSHQRELETGTSTNIGNRGCWTHHRAGLGTREVAHVSWRLVNRPAGKCTASAYWAACDLHIAALPRQGATLRRTSARWAPRAARGSIGKEHFAGERCGGWTAAVREHEARQSFVEIPRNRHKEAHDVVKLAAFHMGEHMSPTNTGRENGCRELAIANLGSGRSASGD